MSMKNDPRVGHHRGTTDEALSWLNRAACGEAYDITWREVESLRERLDKEEEERGRQFGLRCQAEAEVERLMSLVKEWLDGNARLGRPMSIADQRFLNGLNAAVRLAAPKEEKEGNHDTVR